MKHRPHRSLLFFVFLQAVLLADTLAQPASLRGFVTDESDGQPLQGVNVALLSGTDLVSGAATDLDGFFAISIPPGRYTLRATFIGYETHTDTLTLGPDQNLTLNVSLRPDETRLEEVLVEAEQETAGAAAVTAGLQTIRPGDIELIPAPDVSGDLVSYLVTLPGVVTTGDRGGQLFIRGGEPTQNLVLLDGMLLYQPFHLVGFYSAFPSAIIQSTDVYAGGFPARYGGRLSSVIDVATRNGNKRRFAGAVSVAPFVSTALLEGPLWKDRASFLASWRASVIEQGAARLVDRSLPFRFNDGFAKLHVNLSQSSRLSVSTLRTYDRGILSSEEETGEQVVWKNEALGARYILLPAALPVLAELLFSTSRVENTFGPENNPFRSALTQQYNAEAHVTHYLGDFDVRWGLFVRTSTLDSELGGQYQDLQTDREFVTEAGAYLEPEYAFNGGLRIQPSLRIETFPSKGRTFLEPRLRTVWNFGIHRLSMAWGLYHQELVGINDRRLAGDVFTAWTSSPLNSVPEAMHVIAGYQIRPASWAEFALEGFYKTLANLSISEWTAFPRLTTRLQPADGRAYGLDLRMEISHRPFYGFLSYGLAEVVYDAQQRALQHWYGTPEARFHPPHDRRHQVNALGNLKLYGFDLSVRWQFGSGLPFSEALGFDAFVLLDGPTDVRRRAGSLRVLYGPPYQGRLPTYHRLDVSLEREVTFTRRVAATLQAGLINLYDRRNLFYLDLFTLQRVDQLPLIPSFGLKVEIQ